MKKFFSFGTSLLPFYAGVYVFRIFPENDHIHLFRGLHGRFNAVEIAHGAQADEQVQILAQGHVQAADAAADLDGKRRLAHDALHDGDVLRDAAARAVELMGDPEETGRALREQYRHFWLVIVQRIAIFVTIIACVQGFFMLPMLSGVYESIRERVSPAVNRISWEELDGAADLHERILVGDDIVQLNRIEYGVREGERQAVLWVSSYDCIPGRKVYERLIETMLLQSERGETMYGDCLLYTSPSPRDS